MLTNIRSLPPKVDELKLTTDIRKPDVIFVTETWLDPSFPDSLVNLPDYFICRNDRDNRRGGGTAIYIKNGINFEHLPPISVCDFVFENTIINMKILKIFLFCVYIPPATNAQALNSIREAIVQWFDDLLSDHPDHNVIIAGDFNQFHVGHLCADLSLMDIIKQPTRKNNILDHILISEGLSESYDCELVAYDAPIGNSDHATITASPKKCLRQILNDQHIITIYDFRQSHLQQLTKSAEQINWKDLLNPAMNIDDMSEEITFQLYSLLTSSIPRKTVRMSPRDKEWMTPLTKSFINERWRAYREKDWQKYDRLKKKVKFEIEKAKRIYAEKLLETSTGLWKLTRSLSGKIKKDQWDLLIDEYGGSKPLSDAIATIFEESSFSASEAGEFWIEDDDWSPEFSENDVFQELRCISGKKSQGCDGIPSVIYKTLANFISTPLTMLYRKCIQQRSFPESWKHGITVPVPKTSPPKVTELRPITLLPVPSKILERLVLRATSSGFEAACGSSQHGFRPLASTTTALLEISDTMLEHFDDTKLYGSATLAFDFCKAFEKMNHRILLQKLRNLSFPKGFIKWIQNYLKSRTCAVKLRTSFSRQYNILRGVPQGSVLGPPLFCAFMSDLCPNKETTTIVKYADDVTLVAPLFSRCQSEIHAELIQEINNIKQWCDKNKMELNLRKSKALLNTRNPVVLDDLLVEQVHETIVLGVKLDENLNWASHISYISKKANQRLHVLRKLKPFLSPNQLHTVYLTHIRSLFDYCSPVFVGIGKGLDKKLQRIANRAHRMIYGNSLHGCRCTKLTQRREMLCNILFNKIFKTNHILHAKLPKPLRTKPNLLHNIPCRTQKRHNSFFPLVTRLHNSHFTHQS